MLVLSKALANGDGQMIKYAIKNIRELVGHQVLLEDIEKKEAVRLDKN